MLHITISGMALLWITQLELTVVYVGNNAQMTSKE